MLHFIIKTYKGNRVGVLLCTFIAGKVGAQRHAGKDSKLYAPGRTCKRDGGVAASNELARGGVEIRLPRRYLYGIANLTFKTSILIRCTRIICKIIFAFIDGGNDGLTGEDRKSVKGCFHLRVRAPIREGGGCGKELVDTCLASFKVKFRIIPNNRKITIKARNANIVVKGLNLVAFITVNGRGAYEGTFVKGIGNIGTIFRHELTTLRASKTVCETGTRDTGNGLFEK